LTVDHAVGLRGQRRRPRDIVLLVRSGRNMRERGRGGGGGLKIRVCVSERRSLAMGWLESWVGYVGWGVGSFGLVDGSF
jgi:hypothetical protein